VERKKTKAETARSLSIEEQRACFDALTKFVEVTHAGNESAASRALQVAQQVLNKARRNGVIGAGLAEVLARELGTTVEKIAASARDPWPNRLLAVSLAEEHGVSAEAILATLTEPYTGAADVSRVAWVLRMADRDRAAKRLRS
jgi:ribosomal protein S20